MPAARKSKPSSSASAPSAPLPVPSPPSSSSSSMPADQPQDLVASPSQWTEPPWMGFLETTEDALLILEAARRRLIPRVTRRLADRERRLIQSGSVFVFEEEESGIKRWTDGFLWSPSRILGNFLLYRETDKRNPDGTPATRPGRSNTTSSSNPPHGLLVAEEPTASPTASSYSSGSLSRPKDDHTVGGYSAAGSSGLDRQRERILLGSLTNSHKFKEDGMMKKTFSLTLPNTTKTHHLVSYYKVSDVEAGRLRTPSSLPEFAALEISPDFLDKTHFRVQPRVEVGEDGRVRFRGETTDDPDSPTDDTNPNNSGAPANPPPQASQPPVHLSQSSHHGSHPYHPRPPYHHSQSTPSYHSHSRSNSLSTAGGSTDFNALHAAAKARAEESARMYMNGAATAAAAAAASTKASTPSTSGSFFQGPLVNASVGSTASSLGLHYPSALYTNTAPNTATASSFATSPSSSYGTMLPPSSSASSSSGTKSRSGSIYSTGTTAADFVASPTSYSMNDNSTGAPPFQAPQLYNPSQPSAAANAAFATTSYPSSLAPAHRSSSVAYSIGTPSVRSGASTQDDVSSIVSGRMGRSGSRGSEGAASLSSSSTLTSPSEAVTPSVASSRRSSTGASSHYHRMHQQSMMAEVDRMLATKVQPAAGYDYMNFNGGYAATAAAAATANPGVDVMGMAGMDDLNLSMDTMIMSPTEDVTSAGTWCGANTGAGDQYVDYSAYGPVSGYSIPPPTAKQPPQQQQQQQYTFYQPQQTYVPAPQADDYGFGRM